MKSLIFSLMLTVGMSSSAFASEVNLQVEQHVLNYHWSIDDYGNSDRAKSAIIWSASPVLVKLTNQYKIGRVSVFGGIGDATYSGGYGAGGSVTRRSQGSISTIGAGYQKTVLSINHPYWFDALSIESNSTLYISRLKVDGCSGEFSSDGSRKTDLLSFDSLYGLRAKKMIGGVDYTVMPYMGISSLYMTDHNAVSDSLKQSLFDSSLVYGLKATSEYHYGDLTLRFGADYQQTRGIVAKTAISDSSTSQNKKTGIGKRSGFDVQLFTSITYDF